MKRMHFCIPFYGMVCLVAYIRCYSCSSSRSSSCFSLEEYFEVFRPGRHALPICACGIAYICEQVRIVPSNFTLHPSQSEHPSFTQCLRRHCINSVSHYVLPFSHQKNGVCSYFILLPLTVFDLL